MTVASLLGAGWEWEPSVVVGCLLLATGYAATTRLHTARAVVFLTGIAVLLLSLVSPLDTLADDGLFSAHMLQHLVLLLAVPVLLLLGTPRMATLGGHRAAPRSALGHAGACWALGMGAMLAWHLPGPYAIAVHHEAVHIVQHLSLLAGGVLFWVPIIGPWDDQRLASPAAIAYLAAACGASSVLGIVITFAPPSLYAGAIDVTGVAKLARDAWSLSARGDQQVGGLVMWVPGCLAYVGAVLATLVRWYEAPETTQ